MAFTLADVMVIEETAASAMETAQSLQRAINARQWSLQGSYGRAMMRAIESGHCCLATKRASDYWGNVIPSRDDVKEGTKGSVQYVRDIMGDEWADMIVAVE